MEGTKSKIGLCNFDALNKREINRKCSTLGYSELYTHQSHILLFMRPEPIRSHRTSISHRRSLPQETPLLLVLHADPTLCVRSLVVCAAQLIVAGEDRRITGNLNVGWVFLPSGIPPRKSSPRRSLRGIDRRLRAR